MAWLVGATLFVAAALLFLIQPLAARMVLPKFGGTPAVWNTCMLFFQAALLLGYAYAHRLTLRLDVRRQTRLHGLVFLAGALAAPLVLWPVTVARNWAPPPTLPPVLLLIGLLLVSVGLPFLVLSTTAPLLQSWFAATGHRQARDPYFLYAASNAGSLVGLLAYPFLVEPTLPLRQQGWLWIGAYLALFGLIVVCGRSVGQMARGSGRRSSDPPAPLAAGLSIPRRQRFRWMALAFVPSSLMLGVTTYATTDIAPVPLLWVIPLAAYLITFILAFARLSGPLRHWSGAGLPAALLLQLVLLLPDHPRPAWIYIGLHVLSFFVIAFFCHARLAEERPASGALTQYYLCVSAGGVLGGICNAVLAPAVFPIILEYPLVSVLACFLDRAPATGLPDIRRAAAGFLLGVMASLLLVSVVGEATVLGLGSWLGQASVTLRVVAAFLCWALGAVVLKRPLSFGAGVGPVMIALLLAASIDSPSRGRVLHNGRSFFGVHRIYADHSGNFIHLVHAGTLHGRQRLTADGRPAPHPEPLSYYARSSPIGNVFACLATDRPPQRVGIVGLGAGSLAAYGEPGQEFDFFEIDPAIERLARDDRYFTFLRDCRARATVVLGDARLSLARAPDHAYDMLILDAFSGDSIPVHLATREATQLYLRKLTEHGILVFHVSNRYVNVPVVVAALASDAGLVCRLRHHEPSASDQRSQGILPSTWMILARQESDFGPRLSTDPGWLRLTRLPGRPWTDDFADLVRFLNTK